MFRHQLPVFTPLSLQTLLQAFLGRLPDGPGAQTTLARLLASEREAERVRLFRSGTQALQVALRAANDAVGGDIALPAYSCFDLATAAAGAQVRVRFYDLKPETLSPDLVSLEAALVAGARVVVAGPLYGIPLDWPPVQDLVRRYGAILIEDAAQGHGCVVGDSRTPMFGDVSILSFGRGKGWTGGVGGALLSRDAPWASDTAEALVAESGRLGGLVLHVKLFAQWGLGRPALYGLPSAIPWLGLGKTHYREPTALGVMGDRAAALALATRDASRAEADHRRSAARSLLTVLGQAGLVPEPVGTIAPPPLAVPGYLRLPIRLARGADGFQSARRARALGMAPGYPIALTKLAPLNPWHAEPPAPCPGAEALARELVTLPTHSLVPTSDHERIVAEIQRYSSA